MCGYMLMVTFYTELPRDLGLTYDQKMTKLMVTQELVDKAVCPSYVTHQKAISYSWILTITRAYSLYKSTSSTIAFNARFPANRDQLRTDLRLKTILDFLDLWAVIKLLSSKCKLMFISMSRSNWYTSKQKVYNWPSNKSDLRPHYDRLVTLAHHSYVYWHKFGP